MAGRGPLVVAGLPRTYYVAETNSPYASAGGGIWTGVTSFIPGEAFSEKEGR